MEDRGSNARSARCCTASIGRRPFSRILALFAVLSFVRPTLGQYNWCNHPGGCTHVHTPHNHAPHFHSPHGHNPHRHRPHLHSPHSHSPHSHIVTASPSSTPTTASPSSTPTTASPSSTPTTGSPLTATPTGSPATATPTNAPSSRSPSSSPTTGSPITHSPTTCPTSVAPTKSPSTVVPTSSPVSGAPTRTPSTLMPTRNPTSLSPVSTSPTVSPSTTSPTILQSPGVRISVRGANQNGSIPYGKPIRLLAVASLSPYSSAGFEQLNYTWGAEAERHGASGSISFADSRGPALEVPFNTHQYVGGASYWFRVKVAQRPYGGIKGVSVSTTTLVRIAPALSASLTVTPRTGIEYDTRFLLNASALTGVAPFRFRFSYVESRDLSYRRRLETILMDNSTSSSHVTLLPASGASGGNVTVRVRVTDAMGSHARWNASVRVSRRAPAVGNSTPCSRVRNMADRVRILVQCANTSGSTACGAGYINPNSLGLCDAVSQWVDAQSYGRVGNALVTIKDISVEVGSMLDDLITADTHRMNVLSCTNPEPHVNAPVAGQALASHGCADASSAESMSASIWDILEGGVRRLWDLDSDEVPSLQMLNAISELSSTPCANQSARAIEELVNFTRSAMSHTLDEDLTAGTAGDDTIGIASTLISLASYAIKELPEPYDYDDTDIDLPLCRALNGAVDLANELSLRVGQTLLPGSDPVTLQGDSIAARTSVVFTDVGSDVMNFSAPGEDATVAASAVLPPLSYAARNESTRPSAVVWLTLWENTQRCRMGGDERLASGIHTVTVAPVDESGVPRVTEGQRFLNGSAFTLRLPFNGSDVSDLECAYWDTAMLNWNSSACTLSVPSEGTAVCACSHLTEFAVIRRQRADEDVPLAAQAVYMAFVAAYILVLAWAVLAAIKLLNKNKRASGSKKGKGGGNTKIMVLIACGQTGVRAAACLLFSGLVGGFTVREASASALFILVSLPYVLSFGLVSLMAFTWFGILNNEKLSIDPFRRLKAACATTVGCLGAISLGLSGWAIYGGDSGSYKVSSVVFCAVCCAFTAVLAYTGNGFYKVARGQAPNSSLRDALRRVGFGSALAAGAFVVQSCLWLAATFADDSMTDRAFYTVTAAYLAADLAVPSSILWITTFKKSSNTGKSKGSTRRTSRGSRGKSFDRNRTRGSSTGRGIVSPTRGRGNTSTLRAQALQAMGSAISNARSSLLRADSKMSSMRSGGSGPEIVSTRGIELTDMQGSYTHARSPQMGSVLGSSLGSGSGTFSMKSVDNPLLTDGTGSTGSSPKKLTPKKMYKSAMSPRGAASPRNSAEATPLRTLIHISTGAPSRRIDKPSSGKSGSRGDLNPDSRRSSKSVLSMGSMEQLSWRDRVAL